MNKSYIEFADADETIVKMIWIKLDKEPNRFYVKRRIGYIQEIDGNKFLNVKNKYNPTVYNNGLLIRE